MGDPLIVILLLFFQLKHLLVDFFLQNRFPYMWMNKGRLCHPGGWLHAGSHGISSLLILFSLMPDYKHSWLAEALIICATETLAHFLIDYYKVRLAQNKGWKCNTSPYFWDLLGVDQFLHQLTYIWMVFVWAY